MLDSNKDSLKLEAMKRIVAVSISHVSTGVSPVNYLINKNYDMSREGLGNYQTKLLYVQHGMNN